MREPETKPAPARPRLGDLLVSRGLIDEDSRDAAIAAQVGWDIRLGDILRTEHGLCGQELGRTLAEQHGVPLIDLNRQPHDPSLVRLFGLDRCLQAHCLPWRRIGARTVVLVEHADQFERLERALTACFGPVIMAFADRGDIESALTKGHRRDMRKRAESRVAEDRSCRDWRGQAFSRGLVAVIALLAFGALLIHETILIAVTAWALLTLIAVTLLKFTATLATLRRRRVPEARVLPLTARLNTLKKPVVTLLVPLLNEDEIAEGLVSNLTKLTYPRALLDVAMVVEADDFHTQRTLALTKLPPNFRVVRVPVGELRTKPRALNYALDFARGSIIGVYDAEDAPAADQIDRVVAQFERSDPWVACIQGALDFYNRRQGWLTRCFTLDYAVWFRTVLPGLSRLRLPLPLGGTTLFFRRTALESLGAWDAHNVTEDADLGIRLARHGYRTDLIDSVTREQATSRTVPWVRQRSRWLKGYAMTYAVHMRTPLQLWRDLGARGFLSFQVMFLGTISQYTLAPILWSWWLVAFGLPHPVADALPLGWSYAVIAIFLACEAISIAVGIIAARRARCLALTPWLLTMTFYHMLATLASYKAMLEMITRPFFWDKTHHPEAVEPEQDPAIAVQG